MATCTTFSSTFTVGASLTTSAAYVSTTAAPPRAFQGRRARLPGRARPAWPPGWPAVSAPVDTAARAHRTGRRSAQASRVILGGCTGRCTSLLRTFSPALELVHAHVGIDLPR